MGCNLNTSKELARRYLLLFQECVVPYVQTGRKHLLCFSGPFTVLYQDLLRAMVGRNDWRQYHSTGAARALPSRYERQKYAAPQGHRRSAPSRSVSFYFAILQLRKRSKFRCNVSFVSQAERGLTESGGCADRAAECSDASKR